MEFPDFFNKTVPMEPDGQHEFLLEMRSAFLEFRHQDYQSMLRNCCLSEEDIAARPEFYIHLSRMLYNQLILVPQMADGLLFPGYIGEDMVDCGHPELEGPGKRLKDLSDLFREGGSTAKIRILIPECPEAALDASRSPECSAVHFIKDFIGPSWSIPGENASAIALLSELAALPEPMRVKVIPSWLIQGWTYDMLVEQAMAVCLEFSQKSMKYDWIESICRLGSRNWPENQRYSAYWVDSLADRGRFHEALELISDFERKGLYNPWLRHLRTWNLMMTGDDASALRLSRERLEEDPKDIAAAFVTGDIHLKNHRVDQAIKAYSWAYRYGEGNADALVSLGRAFHAAYLPVQADLCMEKLAEKDPARASGEKLPVELLIKCTARDFHVQVNGKDAGQCPLYLRNMLPGMVRLTWRNEAGKQFETEVELLPGHVQKYKYDPGSGEIDVEISRDGMISIAMDGNVIELPVLMKDYLVKDPSDLPLPCLDEFLDKSLFTL